MSSYPDHRFRRDGGATGKTNPRWWLQVAKRALERFKWKRDPEARPEPIETVKSPSSFSRLQKVIFGLAAVVLLIIAIPVALIIRVESRRAHYYRQGKSVVARGESLLGMNQGTAKPKPSPYKYTLDTPITRPSNPIVFTPPVQQKTAPAVAPQIPTQAAPVSPALPQTAATQPSPAAAPAKAPFTPIVYPAHHDKHFGGCSGHLTLNSTGLNFRCAEDPEGSIQVALAEIGAVDDNGIQTVSGKKYHFTIPGMSKPAAQQLFANWLHQVR